MSEDKDKDTPKPDPGLVRWLRDQAENGGANPDSPSVDNRGANPGGGR